MYLFTANHRKHRPAEIRPVGLAVCRSWAGLTAVAVLLSVSAGYCAPGAGSPPAGTSENSSTDQRVQELIEKVRATKDWNLSAEDLKGFTPQQREKILLDL